MGMSNHDSCSNSFDLLTMWRSSGIQVLPAIQPYVEKVTTFIREPAYVSPVRGMENHVFTDVEKHAFLTRPNALLEYRKGVENGLNGQFDIFLKNTDINRQTRAYISVPFIRRAPWPTYLGPSSIPANLRVDRTLTLLHTDPDLGQATRDPSERPKRRNARLSSQIQGTNWAWPLCLALDCHQ